MGREDDEGPRGATNRLATSVHCLTAPSPPAALPFRLPGGGAQEPAASDGGAAEAVPRLEARRGAVVPPGAAAGVRALLGTEWGVARLGDDVGMSLARECGGSSAREGEAPAEPWPPRRPDTGFACYVLSPRLGGSLALPMPAESTPNRRIPMRALCLDRERDEEWFERDAGWLAVVKQRRFRSGCHKDMVVPNGAVILG